MFAAVLAVAHLVGHNARVVLPRAKIVHCADPVEALADWRAAGVRGRTLVHAARRISLDNPSGPATPANFISQAVRDGIVRRIFHVIPSADWPEVEHNVKSLPGVLHSGETYRLVDKGMPIIVMRLADLHAVSESVIVDVDVDRYTEREVAELAQQLRRGAPRSDLVTWYGRSTPTHLEAWREPWP